MIIIICIVWLPSVLSPADYLLFVVLNKMGFVENHSNSHASNCCFHNKLLLKARKDSGFLNLQKTDLSTCTYHVLGVFLSPHGAILPTGAVLQSSFCHTNDTQVHSPKGSWGSGLAVDKPAEFLPRVFLKLSPPTRLFPTASAAVTAPWWPDCWAVWLKNCHLPVTDVWNSFNNSLVTQEGFIASQTFGLEMSRYWMTSESLREHVISMFCVNRLEYSRLMDYFIAFLYQKIVLYDWT